MTIKNKLKFIGIAGMFWFGYIFLMGILPSNISDNMFGILMVFLFCIVIYGMKKFDNTHWIR